VIAPNLVTDGNCVGCWKSDDGKLIPFATEKGTCNGSTVKDGIIK